MVLIQLNEKLLSFAALKRIKCTQICNTIEKFKDPNKSIIAFKYKYPRVKDIIKLTKREKSLLEKKHLHLYDDNLWGVYDIFFSFNYKFYF